MHDAELSLWGVAALAVLLLGEVNFWRPPVRYQSEPMSSIGNTK
jgi:hypothetical protein